MPEKCYRIIANPAAPARMAGGGRVIDCDVQLRDSFISGDITSPNGLIQTPNHVISLVCF